MIHGVAKNGQYRKLQILIACQTSMLKINQLIKLNNQVEVKRLLIQFKEIMEYDLDISLEGMRDAFHVK